MLNYWLGEVKGKKLKHSDRRRREFAHLKILNQLKQK